MIRLLKMRLNRQLLYYSFEFLKQRNLNSSCSNTRKSKLYDLSKTWPACRRVFFHEGAVRSVKLGSVRCQTFAILFSLSASKLFTSILVSEGHGHGTLCCIKRTLNEGQVSVSNQYDYGDKIFL